MASNFTHNAITSYYTFCHFFKQKTNRTLIDFVKEVRIGHAAKLLLEGIHNVTVACYESGYNNISNFNKHFKEVKGLSPRDFMKQYQGINRRRKHLPEILF